jgi:hypothetical protein
MEKQNQEQLVSEVRQLSSQYLNEVPSRRRAWPRSIKERVLQLLQLELSCEDVATLTGIPSPTIYSWKPKSQSVESTFLPIQVVAEPPSSVRPIEPRKRGRKKGSPTIIVIAPNGTRFEGLDLKSALALGREIGSWG